ncbi:hypothetical protein EmuJ_000545300 [Echinococcus multilocularis]|uniref:Uncharacterized protein n=1 Tax=Echinococcus multilocularis TaxID=6211 RepID=A0A068Y7H2_ECHMU|nr:hypothetical protein EmuJ_000545300 [Echinococcus multilocularis]
MSLPSWRYILLSSQFSAVVYQHINQWPWLDKRLCRLLFPQRSHSTSQDAFEEIPLTFENAFEFIPLSIQNAFEAMRYQEKQMDSYSRFLSSRTRKRDHGTVYFRIMPNTNEVEMSPMELLLRKKATRINYCRISPLNKLSWRIISSSVSGKIRECDSSHEVGIKSFQGNPGKLQSYDCIIYLMNTMWMSNDDLISTLESLAPHQILVIAVVEESRKNKKCMVQRFVETLRILGVFGNSPLTSAPTNWRL